MDWISVKDELPCYDKNILLYSKDENEIVIGQLWKEWLLNDNGDVIDMFHVHERYYFIPTHWMPLPKPPKE